jgi:hypothetical protein
MEENLAKRNLGARSEKIMVWEEKKKKKKKKRGEREEREGLQVLMETIP